MLHWLKTLLLSGFLALLVCDSGVWSQELGSAKPVAELRFDRGSDLVAVPVKLAGTTPLFVLDTGSTAHCFDTSLEKHLGSYVKDVIANRGKPSEVRVRIFRPPTAHLGCLGLPCGTEVATIDLGKIRARSGIDARGMLGLPVFTYWTVQIDFDSGVIRFFPPMSHDDDWGECIPIRRKAGGVYVDEMMIGEKRFRSLVLDTGYFSHLELQREEYEQLEQTGMIRTLRSTSTVNAGGGSYTTVGRLHVQTSIGPFVQKEMLVDSGHGRRIGLRYLSRFLVTIDVPNGRLYLRRGESYSKRGYEDMSGIYLAWTNGETIVQSVEANSPADKAGILGSDKVVELNGQPIQEWQFTQVRRLLRSEPEKLIQMAVLRNGTRHEMSFRLKEQF